MVSPISLGVPFTSFLIAEHLCTNFAPETKPHFLRPILFRRQTWRNGSNGPLLLNEDLKKLLLGIPKIIVACPLYNTTACMLVSGIPTEIAFY